MAEPTEFDAGIRPLRGWMLVELWRRDKEISLLGGIIDTVDSVPPTTRAIVVRLGEQDTDPGFAEGDIVEIVPHGGSNIPVPVDHAPRMVVPVSLAIGVWEEE